MRPCLIWIHRNWYSNVYHDYYVNTDSKKTLKSDKNLDEL